MATNFLWNPGTSNDGLTASAFTLLNAEMNAVATAGFCVSSGTFTNTNAAQAIWAQLFLTLGAIGSATATGANCCGWFAQSYDGTNYEQTTALPSRSPDFIVPVTAGVTIGAGTVFMSSGLVLLPALKFKVVLQNNCGQTLAGSAANFLRAAPSNMQGL